MNVPLSETAFVTLDSSGNGIARAGPLTAREVWNTANAHVSCSSNLSESQCITYVGDAPIPSNFRDQTVNGSSGDSTDRISADVIKSPHKVIAQWSNGDPGAIATLAVTGTKDI